MKGAGTLVVSLRGVNLGFWLTWGVLGKTPLYLAVKVSFRLGLSFYYPWFYLLDSCNQVFLAVKKG